jgi:uncharacterized protein DUF4407
VAKTSGLRLPWLQRVFSTLGGADCQILDRARVDTTEMTGRGIATLIPAVFGGLAAVISFRYAYGLSLGAAAAAGAGWAAVVLCFDLSLMASAPDRGPVARAVTFGLRAVVSVLAAFTFASAIVIFMFARDISVQVAKDQQTDLARYSRTVIVPKYAAAIEADQNTITTDQGGISQVGQAVSYWLQRVANDEVQMTCEAQGVRQFAGCGQGTGLTGQGPVYQVRLAELGKDQAALARIQAQARATTRRLSPQLASAQTDLSRIEQQEQADYAAAKARYGHDDGLIARWRALGELENAYGGVRTQAWLLEGLIIAIDLAAVIAKMTSKTPSYNRVLEAERKKVVLRVAQDEEEAADRVELSRAEREARAHVYQGVLDAQVDVAFDALDAWKRVARHWIGAWVDERTGGSRSRTSGADTRWPPNAGPGRQHGHGEPAGVPVNSHSLGGLIDVAHPYERMPVTMPKPLTRIAWLGTCLQAVLGGALLIAHATHAAVTGGWLVLLTLAGATVLAMYSRGFRRGPAWAHLAAFGTGLLGLALPVVIVLVNI